MSTAASPIFFRSSGREDWGWGLFDQLLAAALDGAVALAEIDVVAVFIADDLDFDVARVHDHLFEIDVGIVEATSASVRAAVNSCTNSSSYGDPDPFSAAAGGGFDEDGKPELLCASLSPSSTSGTMPSEPGMTGHLTLLASLWLSLYRPRRKSVCGEGPMKLRPQLSQMEAKLAFSLKNP